MAGPATKFFRGADTHNGGGPLRIPGGQMRDEISANSRFLGQCQHTDWIGLCWTMLRQPLACPGVLMVASGGTTYPC